MRKATPEDLIGVVISADDHRRKTLGQPAARVALGRGLRHSLFDRLIVEPSFNLLGLIWGQAMMGLPSALRRSFIQWVNCKMGGYTAKPNPDLQGYVDRTVAAAMRVRQTAGQWPAFLILTSHPNTEGPHQWLRFEVLRQGLQIADAVVEAEHPGQWFVPHPKCFLAIDPFALDTVSSPVGAFYGSWMHQIYMAWDRQPSTQSWIQKHWLLRGSDYSRIGWRLLKTLRKDVPILMVLAGGLPSNARILYAAREFVRRLPIKRWKIRKLDAQLILMKILMKPEKGVCAADTGTIGEAALGEIGETLRGWSVDASQIDAALQDLQQEFRLPVPSRERLFRVLIKRLPLRGKPLLVLGIRHSETAPHVYFSEPCEVSRDTDPGQLAKSFARFFMLSGSAPKTGAENNIR